VTRSVVSTSQSIIITIIVDIQITAKTGATNISHELPVVYAIVEMNADDYDVILSSNVLKELLMIMT